MRNIPGAGYVLVVLVLVFSIFGSGFATASNAINIGVQSSVLLLLSLPMTFIIMSEGLDLSMGAVLSLCGVILALLLAHERPLPIALAAALGVGLAFGVANGLLVAGLAIPPFVATLGTLGIAQGVALVMTDGQSVVGIGDRLPALYNSTLAGLPFSVLAAAAAYGVLHVLLYHTRFGVYVSAIGGNREALVLAGVPAARYHIAIYGLGGLMAGFAALLLTGRMNSGHPVAAIGMEFDAIAAVIVGGTSFERGRGTLAGTLVGVCTIGVLKNGLNVLDVSSSLQVASIGLLVIVALLVDSVRGRAMKTVAYRLIAVAVVGAMLTLMSDVFFTSSNLLNVLRQASLTFLIASGLTLTILTAGLDLSVGANVGLSACLAATVMKATGSIALGAGVGLLCGAAVGILNGMMITLLRLPPFIATYGMLWVLHGITYWFMAGDTIHGFSPGFRSLGSGYWLGVPVPIYVMGAFLVAGGIFTRYTTFGHEVYAIGSNREAARLSGIPVRARLNLVYVLSGAMAGLAAVVYLARLNSAEADIGEPLTLPAIAAVLIGGASLFGGVGSLFGTLVGAVTLTLVLNGMNLLAIDANWQPLVTGVIVLLAVWIDVATRQRAEARA